MHRLLAVFLTAALIPAAVRSGESAERLRQLEGNSFLLEEAYTQEEDKVGHAATLVRDRATGAWLGTFSQDWPLGSERHQGGYAISYGRQRPGEPYGIADTTLSYKYQAIEDEQPFTLAPRVSLVLPTGDPRRGLGNGGLGFQVNLPASLRIGDWAALHTNVGGGFTPAGRSDLGAGAATWSAALGQGLVLAPHRNVSLLVEMQWVRSSVSSEGRTDLSDSLFLSPGIRAGGELGSWMVVAGIALPMGVGPSAGEVAMLGYLSVGLPFREPTRHAAQPAPAPGDAPEAPALGSAPEAPASTPPTAMVTATTSPE